MGPADFSFSRGQMRLMGSPEIRQFEERVIAKSLEYGIRPRIEIGAVEQASATSTWACVTSASAGTE